MRKKPAYGQHFLHDRNILSEIVAAAALEERDPVLEIGVGTGKLTEMILARNAAVTGVEVDGKLFPALEEKFRAYKGLRLVKGDILRLSWNEILPAEGRMILLGNLPYAISTQIVFRVLEHRDRIKRAVFLVQWEVGVRMTAKPGNRDYGILSVVCQMFGRPEILRKVPPSVFLPPPKVDSALIRWELFEDPGENPIKRKFIIKVVKASFGQRRKKLLNSLSAGIPDAGKENINRLLGEMGLRETVRAEELTVQQFAELADGLLEITGGDKRKELGDKR